MEAGCPCGPIVTTCLFATQTPKTPSRESLGLLEKMQDTKMGNTTLLYVWGCDCCNGCHKGAGGDGGRGLCGSNLPLRAAGSGKTGDPSAGCCAGKGAAAQKRSAKRSRRWAMKDHLFYRLCAAATVGGDALFRKMPTNTMPPPCFLSRLIWTLNGSMESANGISTTKMKSM